MIFSYLLSSSFSILVSKVEFIDLSCSTDRFKKESIPRMKIIVRKKTLNFFEKLPPINISTKKVIQTFTNTDIIMNQVQAKPTCFK